MKYPYNYKNIKSTGLLLLLGIVCSLSVNASVISHRYSFDSNTSDSVGMADLTLVGAASVSNGKLNLPGGSPRTNHAAALGTAVTELAGTINGSSAISMEVWFSQDQLVSWSKLFMAGSSTASNMDITSTVSNLGTPKIQINDSSHSENNVQWNTSSVSNATDYYIAGIWDTVSDMLTIYAGQVGGSLTSFSSSMGGNLLSDVNITELYLGSAVAYGDQDFNGQIDEFRIWGNALNAVEIAASFRAGPNAVIPESSTIALLGLGLAGLGFARRKN